jgi:ABC-2 type transport system permease protein
MPVYEESYRSWEGRLIPKPKTFFVIARTGIRLLWQKGLIFIMILAYIPFIIKAIQIFVASKVDENSELLQMVKGLQINPEYFFRIFMGRGAFPGQMVFFILVLIFVGAGLIANDRRLKALSIYFSKPVSFWDYVVGKWLVIAFYGSMVTLVPSLLLFLFRVIPNQDWIFLKTYFWIPLASMGYVFIATLTMGGLVLAFSSMARSTRMVGLSFFALLTFTDVFRLIFRSIPNVGLISLTADINQIGTMLFGITPIYKTFSVWSAVFVLVGVTVFCLLILKWKIRPTEVVR